MFRWMLVGSILVIAAGCSAPPEKAPATEKSVRDSGTDHETGTTAVDWCAGHSVPESVCTRCNPELIPAFKAKGDWCAGHDLPESQCTLCNPEIKFEPPAAARETSERIGEDPALFCFEHDVSEAECALCASDLAPVLDRVALRLRQTETPDARLAAPKIRLASKEAAAKAGIRAVRIGSSAADESIQGSAELRSDENRSSFLSSPVSGVVRQVAVHEGDHVDRGQILCRITSPEIAETRAAIERARGEATLTRIDATREEELWGKKATSMKEVEAARARAMSAAADLSAAEARLDAQAQGGDPRTTADSDPASYLLRAPQAGYVSARHVRPGDVVAPGDPLMDVADMDHLWADIAVVAGQIRDVRVGDSILFEAASIGGRKFPGRVLGVTPGADPRHRTVIVRAALENPDRILRPGLFGTARFQMKTTGGAITVPRSAVLRYADRPVAFVRLTEDLYEVRPLETGAEQSGMIQVLAGLASGDDIVTDGAFLLKTQITRGSIGAGCCELPEAGSGR